MKLIRRNSISSPVESKPKNENGLRCHEQKNYYELHPAIEFRTSK